MLNIDNVMAEVKCIPITCECRNDKISQLIAMNIGEAAPLPCIAPCRGRFGSPSYE